jgi:uncharacterized membrane protein YbaN (DUF454 family)
MKVQTLGRPLWFLGGILSLALGCVGIFLPLLPTTPFVILAAACFAQSSPRLHGWLTNHRLFGPLIRDWRDHRAIPRRGKIAAVVAMAAAFGFSLALGLKPWALVAQGAVLLVTGSWIVTRPDSPET